MYRNTIQNLITWKTSEDRKPLVLKGARQVGKTWLMKEFSQSCYDSFVYFNFDEEDVRILQKYPKSSANWFKSMKITFPNPMKSSCTVLSVKGQGACF